MSPCDSGGTFIASVAFFAVGAALFLATAIFWIVCICKATRKKIKAMNRPLPLAPPTMEFEVQASGKYIDLQGSIDNYDSVDVTTNGKEASFLHYIPRDAMHETFDGSRMPRKEAPKPPNFEPKLTDKDHEKRKDQVCAPDLKETLDLHDVPRDAMHETFDGSRMPTTQAPKPPNQTQEKLEDHNKTGELENTYEMLDASTLTRDRPPTIPVRQFRK